MMIARALLITVLIFVQLHTALAAPADEKSADSTDCATLANTAATGTATDRFMREWCQRNASTASPTTDPATHPQTALPIAAVPVNPSRYSNEDSADSLNSSRLPPGYHCHMLKFGERICHGGLD